MSLEDGYEVRESRAHQLAREGRNPTDCIVCGVGDGSHAIGCPRAMPAKREPDALTTVESKREVVVTNRSTGQSFRVEPKGDRMIVQPIEEKGDRMVGSLFIPDSRRELPTVGRILAIGPGRYEGETWIPTTMEAGDIVVFGKHAGTEATIWGQDVLYMREGDIMSVLHDVELDEL